MKFSRVLNEAFSPSMPKWLKNYFLYNDYTTDKNGRLKTNKKDIKTADPNYSGLRGAKYKDRGRDPLSLVAVNIFNQQLKLDLSRAQFYEVNPIPKLNGPMFSDPNKLCISYLKSKYDETIWIKDKSAPHERFTLDDGKTITLQGINNKQYQQVCKGFCWLDLTDRRNFRVDLQNQRELASSGSIERDIKRGKAAERGNTDFWDKSGYKKIPLVDRYANQLAKIRQTKLAGNLLDVREKLVQLKEDLKSILDLSLEDSSGYGSRIASSAYQATSRFDDAVGQLYQAINEVDYINQGQLEGDELTELVNRAQRTIEQCNTYIKRAYQHIQSYLPVVLDDTDIVMSDDDWSEFE